MQFPDTTGRSAVLDLSSSNLTMLELATFTAMMRRAQQDVEISHGPGRLWYEVTVLRLEVRAEFIKRYLQHP
jgi:hypothetical protein